MRPSSNEDKSAWCEEGVKAEVRFAGPLLESGCTVFQNPAKRSDKYSHDFFFVAPCDLKTIRTRFQTANRYGFDPKTAITLNCKDLQRYLDNYPHIVIIFDIDYGDFQSIRYANLREIRQVVQRGLAIKHTYEQRVDDTKGNARDSYVLDALWFREL